MLAFKYSRTYHDFSHWGYMTQGMDFGLCTEINWRQKKWSFKPENPERISYSGEMQHDYQNKLSINCYEIIKGNKRSYGLPEKTKGMCILHFFPSRVLFHIISHPHEGKCSRVSWDAYSVEVNFFGWTWSQGGKKEFSSDLETIS